MHLDVGLVEEAPVAYLTVVHHLLALVPLAARSSSTSSASASLLTTAAKKALKKGIESKAFRDKCSFFMQIKLEDMRDQGFQRHEACRVFELGEGQQSGAHPLEVKHMECPGMTGWFFRTRL